MSRARRSPVRKYHDRVADRYDHSYNDAFWQWHDALTWDYLKPFLPRDLAAPLIDLGCGTGKWAARLLKSGFRVTCVDISPRMLDQARRKIDALGMSDRADFVQADLTDLSVLGDRRFGLAVAFGEPIGCTSSPPRALTEIRKSLDQAGVLVATFDNRLACIDHYLRTSDAAGLSRLLRDGKTHWLTKSADEQFTIITYTPAELKKLLERAGFDVLDLVGKTVLPMREHREKLDNASDRRQWTRIEKRLARDAGALGRAPHLQVACRVRPD